MVGICIYQFGTVFVLRIGMLVVFAQKEGNISSADIFHIVNVQFHLDLCGCSLRKCPVGGGMCHEVTLLIIYVVITVMSAYREERKLAFVCLCIGGEQIAAAVGLGCHIAVTACVEVLQVIDSLGTDAHCCSVLASLFDSPF